MRISDWSSDVCSSYLGVEAVKERLLYRQLIECARCFEEGVLETPEDGDIGAIFGWGFAPYTGGPFSHMDTVGIGAVVAVLDRLAAAHGARVAPTAQLREMGASGATLYRPVPSLAAPSLGGGFSHTYTHSESPQGDDFFSLLTDT